MRIRLLLAAVGSLAMAHFASAAPILTPFGSASFVATPTWRPTSFVMYSPDIGLPPNYDDFGTALEQLMPAPFYQWDPVYSRVPDSPRPAGFDFSSELINTLAAAGITNREAFDQSEFHGPSSIGFAYSLVPTAAAPIGSSPDFASGPIIPNVPGADTPMRLQNAAVYFNGVPAETPIDYVWPGLDDLATPQAGDGQSHIAGVYVTNDSFLNIPVQNGVWEFHWRIIDHDNNGFDMVVPFTITPEPASAGAVVLAGLSFRRRRG